MAVLAGGAVRGASPPGSGAPPAGAGDPAGDPATDPAARPAPDATADRVDRVGTDAGLPGSAVKAPFPFSDDERAGLFAMFAGLSAAGAGLSEVAAGLSAAGASDGSCCGTCTPAAADSTSTASTALVTPGLADGGAATTRREGARGASSGLVMYTRYKAAAPTTHSKVLASAVIRRWLDSGCFFSQAIAWRIGRGCLGHLFHDVILY